MLIGPDMRAVRGVREHSPVNREVVGLEGPKSCAMAGQLAPRESRPCSRKVSTSLQVYM